MNRSGQGNSTRYDRMLDGNHIERERQRASSIGVPLYPGLRFCETCQQRKPKDSRPAVKGWKCAGCAV